MSTIEGADSDALTTPKSTVRNDVLRRRRALGVIERTEFDHRFADHLRAELGNRTTVAGYVPMGTEPGATDPIAFLTSIRESGASVILPVLQPDYDLDWSEFTDAKTLVAGERGLSEPSGRRLGVTAIATADLIIVPAVAVDRRGMRLGRGGGSYDRALARRNAAATVVALLFDGELLDSVPSEVHDHRVDAVITPSLGWVRLGDPPPKLGE